MKLQRDRNIKLKQFAQIFISLYANKFEKETSENILYGALLFVRFIIKSVDLGAPKLS